MAALQVDTGKAVLPGGSCTGSKRKLLLQATAPCAVCDPVLWFAGAQQLGIGCVGDASLEALRQETSSCPLRLCCEPAMTAWLCLTGAATLHVQDLQLAPTESSICSGKVQVPAACCIPVWNAMWVPEDLRWLAAGRIA